MNAQELDVIIRVAGATLLVWAAIRMRSDGRPWFIALAICLCGFLAGNTADASLRLSAPLGTLAALVAGYAAVFLWWWCLSVFDASFRPRGAVLAVGVLWIVIASFDRGLFGPWIAEKGLSWGLIGLGLIMVGHLAWRLLTDRDGDTIDQRRQARIAVVILLGGQLLADLCIDLVMGLDWQPAAFPIVQNGVILAFVGWLLSLDLTKQRIAVGEAAVASDPSGISTVDEVAAARLRQIMETERPYLDPGLSFADMVRAMGTSERQVRRAINRMGYDHFRTFVNASRVAEARRRLASPAHQEDKLIAIAFDCGFASLASFNRVFRDMEGRPPSAFRANPVAEAGQETGSEERSVRF